MRLYNGISVHCHLEPQRSLDVANASTILQDGCSNLDLMHYAMIIWVFAGFVLWDTQQNRGAFTKPVWQGIYRVAGGVLSPPAKPCASAPSRTSGTQHDNRCRVWPELIG